MRSWAIVQTSKGLRIILRLDDVICPCERPSDNGKRMKAHMRERTTMFRLIIEKN